MIKKVFLCFMISIFSFSQELITVEQAIQYALKNSNQIKILKNDVMITDNNTSLGSAGLLPTIIINSGYNNSVSNSEFEFNSFINFGGDEPMDEIEAENAKSEGFSSSIALNYTLFNGFSGIYTLKKFKYLDKLSQEKLQFEIENKIIEVVMKYYEFLNKQNLYNVLKETYDISLDRYQRSLEKSKYGSSSNLELLNAEIDLNTDLINFNNSFVDLNATKNDLFLLIGTSDSSFVFDQNVVFNNKMSLKDLIAKQKENNISILIAELNYEIAIQDLKISKSKLFPKLDFSTSFSFNKMGSETSFISRQTDTGVFGMFNLQFPIFSGDIRRKNIKNARLNLESKTHQLEEVNKVIQTSMQNSYNLYTEGLKNLEIQKKNLNNFKLNFEKSKDLYLLGQLSSVDFRGAQLNLMNFQINYSNNLFNTKIQEYILYQFAGMLIMKED